MMNKLSVISLVALSFAIFSCGNRKVATIEAKTKDKQVEESNVETNQNSKRPSEISARIVEMSKDFTSDPFTILDAHIDGNLLHLTMQYSGGCGKHTFEVLGSAAIMKSLPPQRPVLIIHRNNGDNCRALITEELTVDISEFAYQKEEGSEIHLIMEGRERLKYVYSASANE
jgi:hypothetical protein